MIAGLAAAEAPGPRFQTAAVGAVLNMRGYVAACETLYDRIFAALETRQEEPGSPLRLLDAGGSFGAFGLSLAHLGVPVAVWERFGGLGSRAERVIATLNRAGASVVAGEPGEQTAEKVAAAGKFDLIVCLALHPLTNSATEVVAAAGELLSDNGELLLGVASEGFWPPRLRRLRGKRAREPAEGAIALGETVHTRAEVGRLLGESRLRAVAISRLNYTPRGLGAPAQQLLLDNVMRVCPPRRETMLARAVRERC